MKESEEIRGTACSVCGGVLILRTNKRDGSKFWGCSNYPRCRYSESVTRELATWLRRYLDKVK